MVFVVISLTILIIFPIFLSVDVILSLEHKKLYFGIYLFNFVSILGGYVQLTSDGIVIHYSNKKAKIIPYIALLGFNKTVKPLKDYHIISYESILELGNENDMINASIFAFIYAWHNEFISQIVCKNKWQIKINNDVNIYQNKSTFNYYLHVSSVFNMLMIILSLVKILLEKMHNGIRKQQN